MAAQRLPEPPAVEGGVEADSGVDADAWALPDTLPPLDLTALDRALEREDAKTI